MRNVVIIGGGLAGLVTSIQLIRGGIPSVVIEKKSYPFHRVCGEYISNEALPFLKTAGLYPDQLNLPQIKFFELSSVRGKRCVMPLGLGGFGISRYAFDHHLYKIAKSEGVTFQLDTEVLSINFKDDVFEIESRAGKTSADLVIGSFGKRSRIDVQQNRSFLRKRSPYVGIKYHVQTHHPDDLVSIHNFHGGYCGVCNVEDGVTNLCYLTHRDNVRNYGDIALMEREVLFKNPLIHNIFRNATFVFDKPEVINEISFQTKEPVRNHILMAGDAAGMIAPVCGNGMAIAMHSAKILSNLVLEYCTYRIDRDTLESAYKKSWNAAFESRLWIGRNVQRLFGNADFSAIAVNLARSSRFLADAIVRRTHGRPF